MVNSADKNLSEIIEDIVLFAISLTVLPLMIFHWI
jgi:hypothetical protein